MSTVLGTTDVTEAGQTNKGNARATVQAHGLVSPEGTPDPELGRIAADQERQRNEALTGTGDASTGQQDGPPVPPPINPQSKPVYSSTMPSRGYSAVMPIEEVEEILGIKINPTVDQTKEVQKIYLTKAPLVAQVEDGLQSKSNSSECNCC